MRMEQTVLENMVRDVLGNEYREFEVTKYVLTEDVREQRATIVCQIRQTGSDSGHAVEGKGVGMVDALFKGLKKALSHDYPSLDHIHFVDFRIDGDFKSSKSADGSDALSCVRLVVQNSSGRTFDFESQSLSISASSVDVVVKAVEHFVNAEHAVSKVYGWIQDAKRRHRPDLAETYTHRLANLVHNSSYSESIERLKDSLGM